MQKKFPRLILICLVLLLAAPAMMATAQSRKADNKPAVVADTPESFQKQAELVRKGMEPGGRYAGISAADRAKVSMNLDQIAGLLEKRGSAKKLNDRELVQLSNAQESVNATLLGNDDQRLVCEHRKRTGSNFKEKYCMTVKDMEQTRREARERTERDQQRNLRQ